MLVLQYIFENFTPVLTVTIFNTKPEILLNILSYIFSEISTLLSIFKRVTAG